MKKILSFTLILCILLLSLLACDSETKQPNISNSIPSKEVEQQPTTTEHHHSFSDATCQSPKICTTCGKIEGEKLDNHTIINGKCKDCQLDLFDELVKVIKKCQVTIKINDESTSSGYGTRDLFVNYSPEKNLIEFRSNVGGYPCTYMTIYKGDLSTFTYTFSAYNLTYSSHSIIGLNSQSIDGSVQASKVPSPNALTLSAYDSTDDRFTQTQAMSMMSNTVQPAIEEFVTKLLKPLLEQSDSKLTVADYGFINY